MRAVARRCICGGIAGASLQLPRALAKGRWQLAIADYGATTAPTGRVEVALSELLVKAGGRRSGKPKARR